MRNLMTRVSLLIGCCALVSNNVVVAQTPTTPTTQQPKLTLKNTIVSSTNATQPTLSKGLMGSAPALPTTGIPYNPTTGTPAGSGLITGTGVGTGTTTNLADFQRQWAEIILLADHIAILLGVQFNSPIEEAFFVLSVAKLYFASQQTQTSQRRSFSNGASNLSNGVTGSSTTLSPLATPATKSGKLTIANPIISSTPKK